MTSERKWRGPTLLIFSALFYASMNTSAKLSADLLTVWQVGMGRFVLGAAFIPILAWSLRFDLFGRHRGLLVVRAVVATGSFLLLIQALKTIPISVALVLFNLWPVFACLLSSCIAGEPTTKREWPFVIGALTGAILILWPGRFSLDIEVGHFLVLAGSFLAGLAIILVRRLGRDNNSFTIYYYFCVIGGLICVAPLVAQTTPVLPVSGVGWVGLIAVSLFAMIGQTLMNQGMKYLNAPRAGVLMTIDPLASTAFGAIYLGEPLSVRFIVGAVLIFMCGIFLMLVPLGTNDVGLECPLPGSGVAGRRGV